MRAALLAILTLLTGCAAQPPAPAPRPAPDLPMIAPRAMGTLGGLETRVWSVNGSDQYFDDAMRGAIARGARVIPDLDDEGLRLLEMDIADAARLYLSMRAVGPSRQAWFGQAPVWTEVAVGPRVERGAWASVGGRVTPLVEGRLRLLARAWTVPSPDGPALSCEVLAQLADGAMGRISTAPERDGLVFPGLRYACTLRPGRALVVVGEAPGVAWEAWTPPEPSQSPTGPIGTGPIGPEPEPVAMPEPSEPVELPPVLAGPRQALPPTIGELTLGAERVRLVVVLIPRLPERVELTGR